VSPLAEQRSIWLEAARPWRLEELAESLKWLRQTKRRLLSNHPSRVKTYGGGTRDRHALAVPSLLLISFAVLGIEMLRRQVIREFPDHVTPRLAGRRRAGDHCCCCR
jgi:hypothetical protein